MEFAPNPVHGYIPREHCLDPVSAQWAPGYRRLTRSVLCAEQIRLNDRAFDWVLRPELHLGGDLGRILLVVDAPEAERGQGEHAVVQFEVYPAAERKGCVDNPPAEHGQTPM